MRRFPAGLLAPALALALAGAACGGDGGDDDATATTTTTVESTTTTASEDTTTTTGATVGSEATTTTAPADDPGEGDGIGDLELLAPELLVTATELGAGFEERGFTPGEVGACGIGGEPAAVVGTTVGTGAVTVTQELRVYDSPAVATAAFQGRSCGGEVATERIGGDAAVIVEDGTALVVVAVVSDAVTAITIDGQAPSDPLDIAAFAVGKILAAIGR